jgi:putative membrane protein
MRSTVSIVVWGAAVLTLACNRAAPAPDERERGNDTSIEERSTVGTTGQASDTVSHGSDSDARHFAIQASKHNAAEIELGRMAAQKAQNAQVKQFGEMMVRDHTKSLDELKQAAGPHGAELSTEPPDKAEDLMKKLSGMSGAEFDREYMKAMVDGHQEMRGMVQGRLNDAKRMTTSKSNVESAVDQWAAKVLPGVERHLDRAQQIHDAITGNKSNDTR